MHHVEMEAENNSFQNAGSGSGSALGGSESGKKFIISSIAGGRGLGVVKVA